MALALKKGQGLSLKKENGQALKKITVALGWSKPRFPGKKPFDPDVTVFTCGSTVKEGWPQLLGETWVQYYGQKTSPNNAIVHNGDDRAGGDGIQDNETIDIDLELLPAEAKTIQAVVSLYEGKENGQNFGMVDTAYVRILDQEDSDKEIMRFTLSDVTTSTATALLFAEIKKDDSGNWSLKAIGEGFENGLGDFIQYYGGSVAD